MAPKKTVRPAQENISLGPNVREGELVFGVARIFASVRFPDPKTLEPMQAG